jgi:hypothetical protein
MHHERVRGRSQGVRASGNGRFGPRGSRAVQVAALAVALGLASGCSASGGETNPLSPAAGGAAGADGGAGMDTGGGPDASQPLDAAQAGTGWVGDPVTCAHAQSARTYVGCDFWPTVLPNFVGKHFDYVVVVANAGAAAAHVVIERAGQAVSEGDVPSNAATKFFLPWVDELKRFTGMSDTDPSPPFDSSTRVPGGAYHLDLDLDRRYSRHILESVRTIATSRSSASCAGADSTSFSAAHASTIAAHSIAEPRAIA